MRDVRDALEMRPADLGSFRKMMLACASATGARPEDASDAVQEAMTEACQCSDRLAGFDAKQLAKWLKTTTKRKVVDAVRHRKRIKRGGGKVRSLSDLGRDAAAGPASRAQPCASLEPAADDTSPSKRAELNELRDQLLTSLPEDERRVCMLILMEKWSAEKVAEELGLSVDQVGLRLGSGVVRLRKMLKRPRR